MPSRSGLLIRWALVLLTGALFLCPADRALAQAPPVVPSATFLLDSLAALAAIPDEAVRTAALEALWNDLRSREQVPFVVGDSVVFLWRGTATSVHAYGDFNRWGGSADAERYRLDRVGSTNFWASAQTFPRTARLDYKLVRDGSVWFLDPHNPHQQWSGFGPNSEVRMPDWEVPTETIRDASGPRGLLSATQRLRSAALGYDVNYRVYTPASYDYLAALPVLYVTDGHEYSDDRLGALVVVLDNLIAAGVIEPLLAVFLDPRNPANLSENRRQAEYVRNPAFLAFVADEVVPRIDSTYRTDARAARRAIVGTSLGGVCATYFGLERPEVFGNLLIQSPAYGSAPDLLDRFATEPRRDLRLALTTGTVYDGEARTRQMRTILEAQGYPLVYIEVPEGHSWGNWRNRFDETLPFFFPGGSASSAEAVPGGTDASVLRGYPNPFTNETTLRFTLDAPAQVDLAVYDLLGRQVAVLLEPRLRAAGTHQARLNGTALPTGLYIARLRIDGVVSVRLLTRVRAS